MGLTVDPLVGKVFLVYDGVRVDVGVLAVGEIAAVIAYAVMQGVRLFFLFIAKEGIKLIAAVRAVLRIRDLQDHLVAAIIDCNGVVTDDGFFVMPEVLVRAQVLFAADDADAVAVEGVIPAVQIAGHLRNPQAHAAQRAVNLAVLSGQSAMADSARFAIMLNEIVIVAIFLRMRAFRRGISAHCAHACLVVFMGVVQHGIILRQQLNIPVFAAVEAALVELRDQIYILVMTAFIPIHTIIVIVAAGLGHGVFVGTGAIFGCAAFRAGHSACPIHMLPAQSLIHDDVVNGFPAVKTINIVDSAAGNGVGAVAVVHAILIGDVFCVYLHGVLVLAQGLVTAAEADAVHAQIMFDTPVNSPLNFRCVADGLTAVAAIHFVANACIDHTAFAVLLMVGEPMDIFFPALQVCMGTVGIVRLITAYAVSFGMRFDGFGGFAGFLDDIASAMVAGALPDRRGDAHVRAVVDDAIGVPGAFIQQITRMLADIAASGAAAIDLNAVHEVVALCGGFFDQFIAEGLSAVLAASPVLADGNDGMAIFVEVEDGFDKGESRIPEGVFMAADLAADGARAVVPLVRAGHVASGANAVVPIVRAGRPAKGTCAVCPAVVIAGHAADGAHIVCPFMLAGDFANCAYRAIAVVGVIASDVRGAARQTLVVQTTVGTGKRTALLYHQGVRSCVGEDDGIISKVRLADLDDAAVGMIARGEIAKPAVPFIVVKAAAIASPSVVFGDRVVNLHGALPQAAISTDSVDRHIAGNGVLIGRKAVRGHLIEIKAADALNLPGIVGAGGAVHAADGAHAAIPVVRAGGLADRAHAVLPCMLAGNAADGARAVRPFMRTGQAANRAYAVIPCVRTGRMADGAYAVLPVVGLTCAGVYLLVANGAYAVVQNMLALGIADGAPTALPYMSA